MSVIVPFSQPTTSRQPSPEAQPTYLAIAAAQMHADDRLFDNIDDRRGQTAKEADRNMDDDQQLPPVDIGMDKDVFSKLGKEAGTKDLDNKERDNIVSAVTRGMKK